MTLVGVDLVPMVGCEHCVLFHVQDEQTGTEVALVALALAAVLGAVLLGVRGLRRRSRDRAGSLLQALGVLVVPLAMVPLTTVQVVDDLPYVTAPSGVQTRPTHADCDKPLFASWNLQREMPTEEGRVAQRTCREVAARAQRTTVLLLLACVGLVVAGAVVRRSSLARPGSRPTVPAAGP